MKRYYDLRAADYDASTYERAREDPAAARDLEALESLISGLDASRVLDVGCGTGWLTRLLRGSVTLVDQSEAMLELALLRNPGAVAVRADVPPLPFPARSFDLVLSCHLYSHFETLHERRLFIAECRRVAPAVVLVEQPPQPNRPREGWEARPLRDGSSHRVFKRYLTSDAFAAEIEGDVLLDTRFFIAVGAGPVGDG